MPISPTRDTFIDAIAPSIGEIGRRALYWCPTGRDDSWCAGITTIGNDHDIPR